MLGRIVLIIFQLIIAWFAAPLVVRYVPVTGVLVDVLYAVLFAVFTWLTGLVGAEVIKNVKRPEGSSFFWSMALALIGAAVLIAPHYMPSLQFSLPFARLTLPLVGAVIGYQLGK